MFAEANELEGDALEAQERGESYIREAAELRHRAKAVRREAAHHDRSSWTSLFKAEVKRELNTAQFDAIIERVRKSRARSLS